MRRAGQRGIRRFARRPPRQPGSRSLLVLGAPLPTQEDWTSPTHRIRVRSVQSLRLTPSVASPLPKAPVFPLRCSATPRGITTDGESTGPMTSVSSATLGCSKLPWRTLSLAPSANVNRTRVRSLGFLRYFHSDWKHPNGCAPSCDVGYFVNRSNPMINPRVTSTASPLHEGGGTLGKGSPAGLGRFSDSQNRTVCSEGTTCPFATHSL